MKKELTQQDRELEKIIAGIVSELEEAQSEDFNPSLDREIKILVTALNQYAITARERVFAHLDEIKYCLKGLAGFYEENQASLPKLAEIYQI